MDEIVNKVALSGIVTLDINDYRPSGKRVAIDIAEQLWQGIALKEKDYRTWIAEHDWSAYSDAHVAIYCTADAVIPSWAYMLLADALQPYVSTLHYGDAMSLEEKLFAQAIEQVDCSIYQDKRIMLKGCGDAVPTGSYIYLTAQLRPFVKSIMFGEPCSAVPVFKRKKSP